MPLWEKISIGWLAASALTFIWFAYDIRMHPVCCAHHDNLGTRRKHLFSKWAWCELDRITFIPS